MKTATTRPLENRRPKSFPSQLLFVLRLQIFKNKGLRNCCRKIKCFNYSAVGLRFQLKCLVFRKVTACSADGRQLKIKLYIFTFLFMKTSDESRVFLVWGFSHAFIISHHTYAVPPVRNDRGFALFLRPENNLQKKLINPLTNFKNCGILNL